jgi:uncharacterized membrane protein YfcA
MHPKRKKIQLDYSITPDSNLGCVSWPLCMLAGVGIIACAIVGYPSRSDPAEAQLELYFQFLGVAGVVVLVLGVLIAFRRPRAGSNPGSKTGTALALSQSLLNVQMACTTEPSTRRLSGHSALLGFPNRNRNRGSRQSRTALNSEKYDDAR